METTPLTSSQTAVDHKLDHKADRKSQHITDQARTADHLQTTACDHAIETNETEAAAPPAARSDDSRALFGCTLSRF